MKAFCFFPGWQLTLNSYRACSSDNEVPCTDLSGELKSIGSYKFHAKSSFYRFVQKLHEFQVMVNMNDIYTYSIVEIFEQMKLFF
jgi:hypothetical protein